MLKSLFCSPETENISKTINNKFLQVFYLKVYFIIFATIRRIFFFLPGLGFEPAEEQGAKILI